MEIHEEEEETNSFGAAERLVSELTEVRERGKR